MNSNNEKFPIPGYDGYFVVEYEDDWGKNIPLIKACVDYLRKN